MTAYAVQEPAVAFTGLGIWRYRTETSAPPASGQLRFNNANISAATEFYLHETNDDGADVSAFMDLLMTEGSVAYIQDQGDATRYVLIELGTFVDNGVYRTFQIADVIEGSGGEPAQNTQVAIIVSSGAGGGGGDVFKVGIPVIDQVAVWTGDGTLGGDANLLWDGVELLITGPASAAAVTVNSTLPQVRFQENDGGVDEKNWRLLAATNRFRLQTSSDAAPTGGAATVFTVERTGFVVDSFDINAPIFSNTGNVDVGTELLFTERADHVLTPVPTRGILWVRSDNPNVLVFTDDDGTDQVLDPTTFGDVFKVGTPVDEEFAIWTGDGTLASTPDITSDGVTLLLTPLIVRVTQFFRSRGFDDRANSRRCLLFDNVTQWGPADDDEYSFTRVLSTGSMGAAGGAGKTDGGNFLMRGPTHFLFPGDTQFRSGLGVWQAWDESAGEFTMSSGIGDPKTLALTIDANQDAAFEGNVDVGTEALFTERADHSFTPIATRGILWVRDDAPNVLVYTDDAATDFVLAKTVGVPVDNQIGVWTGNGTIEGDANFVWDDTAGATDALQITAPTGLAGGYLVDIDSNQAGKTGAVARIIQNHATATADALLIQQNSNASGAVALEVVHVATSSAAYVARIRTAGIHDGALLRLHHDNPASAGHGLTIKVDGSGDAINIELGDIVTVGNIDLAGILTVGSYLQLLTATDAELNAIANAINTDAGKIQGAMVYNSSTDNPVYAVGNTDGAVWVDGAGTTVNTPV